MLPPTVESCMGSLHSKTFYSPVPEQIAQCDYDVDNERNQIILGVDEAGRGPVLGPMVYGISYCSKQFQDEILKPNYGFDDSKKLTDLERRRLFSKMYGEAGEVAEIANIGYAVTAITPAGISSGMLRYPANANYNLNEQAHDVTIALIEGVLQRGVKLHHVYVDTVGPPASYQKKLEQKFPHIKFTVAKKADSMYCVVSVASIVAKVTRDLLLQQWAQQISPPEAGPIGSGYPADAKTTAWLRNTMKPLMGWDPNLVRFSWQTSETLLDDRGIQIEWEEKSKSKPVWAGKGMLQAEKKPLTLDSWYG